MIIEFGKILLGSKKLDKYKFRTNRVFKDILWHILAVKRCNEHNWSGRKRRDFDFEQFDEIPEVSQLVYLGHNFEKASDNDMTARKKFSVIVNHDYEVFEKRIEFINIKGDLGNFCGFLKFFRNVRRISGLWTVRYSNWIRG